MPSPRRTPGDAADSPAVLVVGDHPAAHAAALRLAALKTPCALVDPGTTPLGNRLVTVSPELADLLPIDPPDAADVAAVRFLGPENEAQTTDQLGTGLTKKKAAVTGPVARVAALDTFRDATRQAALDAGIPRTAGAITIRSVDENGVSMTVGRTSMKAKMLIVIDPLPAEAATAIGAKSSSESAAFPQSLSVLELDPAAVSAEAGVVPMALDLAGRLIWGWLLRDATRAQASVLHPSGGAGGAGGAGEDAGELLREWLGLLVDRGMLRAKPQVHGRSVRTRAVPLAAALRSESVARRSLVCGPAGGFYAATGEDLYPAVWSATLAAETAAKAVKSVHVQDTLGQYRSKWGSSLGEYLQGPEQNLRFLLPLVYKNPVMTDRMAEAILRGRSLVK